MAHDRHKGIVAADGTFKIMHTFVRPGDANLRAVVRPHGRFSVRGISNTSRTRSPRRRTPALTIHTSADPVSYGQTFALSGVLAGGASKKVALLARPKGSSVFTQVQEGTTDGAAPTNSRSPRRRATPSTGSPARESPPRRSSRA